MARPLQHRPATLLDRLSATSAGGLDSKELGAVEKWKPLRASHFSTPPTATINQQSSSRYTNNDTGSKDRADHNDYAGYNPNVRSVTGLVDAVTFPDGTAYHFTYQTTSYQSGTPDGMLASMELPTGGTISYENTWLSTYCGMLGQSNTAIYYPLLAQVSRVTQDGTTTYGRSITSTTTLGGSLSCPVAMSSSTNVVHADGSRENVSFETSIQTLAKLTYGGGVQHLFHYPETAHSWYSSTGQLLKSTMNCYNGSTGNCTTNAITLPITQIATTTTLDNGLTSEIVKMLNTVGLPTEVDEYDYGASSPARKTITQYASLGNSIADRPSSVTVYNTAGAQVAQTTYGYDEYSLTPTSGLPLHVSVSGARGNQTSKHEWLNTTGATIDSHWQYDDAGEVLKMEDPRQYWTSYGYDSATDSCQTGVTPPTPPSGASLATAATCDSNTGLSTSATDANGIKTTYSYDSMLRPTGTTVTTPGGTVVAQTAQSYSGSSLPETITATVTATPSPNEVSSSVLDGLGRLSTQNLPSGAKVVTTYNSMGYVNSVSNPYFTTSDSTYGVISYAYDGLGRKIYQYQPDGTSSQSWAYGGNQTTFTDETGRIWKRYNDSFGRLTEVLEPDGSTNIGNAPTLETDYQYDALNDLVRVDQWGGPSGSTGDRVRTFQYDSLSRLTNACNPEAIAPGATCGSSGPWSAVYGYDANSNVQSKTDANGATIQYSHDPVNRLQVETNPNGTANACFWFDSSSVLSPPSGCPAPPAGLTTGSDLADRVSFEWTSDQKTGTGLGYDAMGRVNAKSLCTPSTCNTKTFGQLFQYDMAGNMISYSNGVGVTTSIAYDSAGRMSLVTSSLNDQNHPGTLWTADTYSAIGLTQAALGNGIVENKLYDKRQRAISDSFATSTGQNIYNYGVGYYSNSLVQSVNDSANGSWTYNLDNMNRLHTAAATSGPFSGIGLQWTIDSWGNRNIQTVTAGSGPQPSFSSTGNNQIAGFCYDNAGHLLDEGACAAGPHQFTYDSLGRLVSPDHGNTVYIYGADGNRVAKLVSGVSTYEYLYDQSGNQITELGSGGSWNRGEVYAGDSHIATYFGGTTYFDHSDWLGDQRVNSTLGGAIQNTCTNLPFGDSLNCTNSVNPLDYTGKQRDSESGNDYFAARYYGNSLGRFLSADDSGNDPDPVPYAEFENPQSLNLNSYVQNNPISSLDPDGHDCLESATYTPPADSSGKTTPQYWGSKVTPGCNTFSLGGFVSGISNAADRTARIAQQVTQHFMKIMNTRVGRSAWAAWR